MKQLRIIGMLLLAIAALNLVTACAVDSQTIPATSLATAQAATTPTVGGCPVFPSDNIWNAPVDKLPVDPNSAAYVNNIGANTGLKADFGSGLWNGGPIGIPYVVVPQGQAKVPVTFDYADESDPGPYPIPPNPPIEGGAQSSGDRHIIVVEQGTCKLYETWSTYPATSGSGWAAGSGAVFDLNSNNLRPLGWTSADAAGLPILPGLVRYDEITAGVINHALRFTVVQTRNTFLWPARHKASSNTSTNVPPMGQRFRLKANFDISGYSKTTQIILTALKTYGMIIADNGSNWYISGAPDPNWNNTVLQELGRVKGASFEAVDESSLQVSPNSGQAKGATVNPTPTPTVTPQPPSGPGGKLTLLPSTVRVADSSAAGAKKLVAVGANPANPPSNSSVVLPVAGTNGIPQGATGITGVLTNVGCSGGGNLRFWRGTTVPDAINLNIPGANSALNLSTSFVTALDSEGKVNLGLGSAAGNSCGYAVDVTGYISAPTTGGNIYLLSSTARLATTQNSAAPALVATGATPGSGSSMATIQAGGSAVLPTNAVGIFGVLTNIGCTGGSNLRLWTGTSVPNSVNLNVPGANPALNLSTSFMAALDSSGKVNLGLGSAAGNSCGYALDVVGYITAATNGGLTLLGSPGRAASTINNAAPALVANGGAPGTGSTMTTIQASGANNIPAGATGILGVLTNVGCTAGGNLRFWTGASVPNSINLNIPGANSALNLSTGFVAALDNSGKVNLGLSSAAGASCGYAVDVIGYIS